MSDTTAAAAQLPQLTKQESYLAAFEDDELLPIIANKRPIRTERDRLGLAQDRIAGTAGGSLALHDELGEQLAGMSHQLKLNAMHFSKSLEEEKSILESSQGVLENNLVKTQASKSKLSSVSSKSRSTTWLTIVSLLVVMIAWVWTYLLIRFT
ncbi:hypothetical protein HD553DRAFT_302709 [Filobasidium floriforme]|uniref:uncharacterized protein n=1 Tax=Filobasidium floriforme TaxID=5210 RepID=UPI001E8E9C79|nr:uncharacterized protein HD553DRAFT_302709 [Filobasidium floriforme]KAH8090545.1 hypothetical protein HD553DRAFT_302709 [Filobasidium floriforme]